MRAAALVAAGLLLLVAAPGCRRGATPPARGSAPPASSVPAQLVPIVEAEAELLRCLQARIERIAPALDAGQAMPPQDESELRCVHDGVARVLELPTPPGGAGDGWWVGLETHRACRGELAFAAAASGDLVTLSGQERGPGQAAWLRAHLAECRASLAALRALLGTSA
jgi:hypothetical protein